MGLGLSSGDSTCGGWDCVIPGASPTTFPHGRVRRVSADEAESSSGVITAEGFPAVKSVLASARLANAGSMPGEDCDDEVAAGRDERTLIMSNQSPLSEEVAVEEKTLAAAFALFVPPGSTCLTHKEVRLMLDYLGLPSHMEDVAFVMHGADGSFKNEMAFSEFQVYAARMGGCRKLFQTRRARMECKHGAAGLTAITNEAALHRNLSLAGITEQDRSYWQLVLPRVAEEFVEAGSLVPCQQGALQHIRSLAKSSHEAALPTLQNKVKRLKYTDTDLWMALAYIRELAPIIVHLDISKMLDCMERDTHYRNLFETHTSGGLERTDIREQWEHDLFGSVYDEASPSERCKYGVFNTMNDYRGIVKCHQYGDSYIVLRDVRLRTTFAPKDSANLRAESLAVVDYYAHVLNACSKAELRETLNVAKHGSAALLGDSSKVGYMKYKEGQIHGPIAFSRNVERLVADTRHREEDADRLKAVCDKHGWKFSWMDEERLRIVKEEQALLGEEAWRQKMRLVMGGRGAPDAPNVPEGQCRKGCGRLTAPGKTLAGKSFTTCCRGCALGFGHDLVCNQVDPKLLGADMCTNGCGRPINPGMNGFGRPFSTCCRSCMHGRHDGNCKVLR